MDILSSAPFFTLKMKRKVLFLIESLAGGGAEKVLLTTLQNIDYNKFDITLCCVVNTGKYITELPTHIKYKYILPAPEQLQGYKKLLYKIKYKLIYQLLPLVLVYKWFVPQGNDAEIAYIEGYATKLLSHSSNKNAKKIAWVHCDMQQFHWTSSLYKNIAEEGQVYNKYHLIAIVSQTSQASFLKEFENIITPVKIIYNPINNENIAKLSQQVADIPTKTGENIRILSTGRLTNVKAFDRLLRIVEKLVTEQHSVELWLLGDGEERTNIEKYIKEHQLSSVVTIWGFKDNPYAYMANCDLFVCSSLSEGYSTAVTEALILGIPVVTTDCSGMHELLGNGKYGVITENNEEALYAGIKELIESPAKLAHYKAMAAERSRDFSLERLMQPIENLLLE